MTPDFEVPDRTPEREPLPLGTPRAPPIDEEVGWGKVPTLEHWVCPPRKERGAA